MGLGGSKAETATQSLSKQITQISENVVQSCVQNTSQNQTLNINNTGIWVRGSETLRQTSTINSKCFSDTTKQTQLQNGIFNAIAGTNTATGESLLSAFGASSSVARTNLTQIIRNNVTMNNIQKSFAAITQNQTVNFTNSGIIADNRLDLSQGSSAFAAATLQAVDAAGIFNTAENFVKQTAAAKTKSPLDWIVQLWKEILLAIMSGPAMILIGVIVFFVVVGWIVSRSASGPGPAAKSVSGVGA